MKFSGGDLIENGCFQRVQLANVGGFFNGAMLMKIVILFKENWSHMDKFQWGQISISNDVVMMMRVYRPFPFRNRSSLSTHFVK